MFATIYAKDVLRLCTLVDSGMSEAEKAEHLFKRISGNLFCAIAPKSPKTTKDFIAEANLYQEHRGRRILKSSFPTPPPYVGNF